MIPEQQSFEAIVPIFWFLVLFFECDSRAAVIWGDCSDILNVISVWMGHFEWRFSRFRSFSVKRDIGIPHHGKFQLPLIHASIFEFELRSLIETDTILRKYQPQQWQHLPPIIEPPPSSPYRIAQQHESIPNLYSCGVVYGIILDTVCDGTDLFHSTGSEQPLCQTY